MIFMTNSEELSIYDKWLELATRADEITMVSPYFTFHDLLIEQCRLGKKLTLITTLRYPTQPEILRRVFTEINVMYHAGALHAKIYLFLKDQSAFAALIGSSNLTQNGFKTNLEANICVSEGRWCISPKIIYDER